MALQGQHALVTGGGRGIGRAIAQALKDAGARVSILGRDEAALREAAEAGAADAFAACDVRDPGAVSVAIGDLSRAKAFDIAIANAGAVETGPFLRSDSERFRRMIDINLIGTVNLFHAVLPGMLERGSGRLVAIASTAGHRGYPYVSAYAAAKHAVIGLVKSLALETARSGVTVNAVSPGYADTDMVASGLDSIAAKTGKSRDEALAAMVKDNPQGRLVAPEEVAAAVLYLCGPGSAAVTGQSLLVNGGEF
ncbi:MULTISPECIES: SDR family oxidoreductase [unclassified Bosea (in: a-proteobacteria)]|uniref:SDR family NAD(P)-dependent oxidoreductase n=1 Tax=unclassified Bosea (in: a-proteobacteria) TaxID=2653178 RepID=UPI000953D47C|nr:MULTISPECIES: SDR family oxidoreductase [unclassified Bosea (in: a-proteobacteria)]TAJ30198.1 MAG: SDR family oxidoreductase [Bosea sp. (in: a-proteobacteria)]SIP92106.1 NAD(P)-dependent dehydrogenase, short-chain alcohol dehydrogenase family [Bosea sp. TND4EK4]